MLKFSYLFLCSVLCVFYTQSARGEKYEVVRVGSSYGDVYFTDVNASGDATGYVEFFETTDRWKKNTSMAVFFDGQTRRFSFIGSLYPKVNASYQDALPDRSSRGMAINNNRQVVGWSRVKGKGVRHAFLWSSGSLKDLGTLHGGNESVALAIGEGGEVAGWSSTRESEESYLVQHAFLYKDGHMEGLGSLVGFKANSEGRSIGYINGKLAVGGVSEVRENDNDETAVLFIEGKVERVVIPDYPTKNMWSVNYIGPNGELAGGDYVVLGETSIRVRTTIRGGFVDGNSRGEYIYMDANTNTRSDQCRIVRPGKPVALIGDVVKERESGESVPFNIRGISDRGHIAGNLFVDMPQGSKRRTLSVGIVAIPEDVSGRIIETVEPPVASEDVEEVSRRKIIFLAHGWRSDSKKCFSRLNSLLSDEVKDRKDEENWKVVSYDWRLEADSQDPNALSVGPFRFALEDYGIDRVDLGDSVIVDYAKWPPMNAVMLARGLGKAWGQIYNKQNPELVHLIGHSAGCHFVNEMCRELSDEDTWVHVTFLDAFEPKDFHIPLGREADFAEHYRCGGKGSVTSGLFWILPKAGRAGEALPNCFNLDVRPEPPKSLSWAEAHEWPVEWYTESLNQTHLYGLKISPLFAKALVTHESYPRAE